MEDMIIEIPSDIAMALKVLDKDMANILRQELAIQLYAQSL